MQIIVPENFKLKWGPQADRLYKSGYGEIENGYLKFETYEVLYLLEKGDIVLSRNGKIIESKEAISYILSLDPEVWLKYIVYSDLRRRGYIVKKGFNDKAVEFRVYEKGNKPGKKPAKYLIRAFAEGSELSIRALEELIEYAIRARKELVLAIVDAQGDVVYYSASKAEV